MIGIRFIFTVLAVIVLLILAVFVRTGFDRTNYEITSAQMQVDRLKQKLTQKQLLLESYISPSSLIRYGTGNEESNIEN